MKNVVTGYCRISVSDMSREGISLENQRRKIELYCEMNDLKLIGIETDEGISAKNLNRPALKKVLQMAEKKEIDGIVIYKLDRLFRNTVDALNTATMLDKKGIALHSINEKLDTKSAMGKFFFTLMASLAEMERNIVAERTADVMQAMRANGKSTGNIPYGYRLQADGVHITPDEKEQKVIAEMKKLREKGLTYQKIADRLNKKGLTTRSSSEWRYQYVFGILKAERSRK